MSYSLSDLSLGRLSDILFPADIALVVLSTLAIDILAGVVSPPATRLRLFVGGVLLFVLPGYAFVAALFPARASRVDALDGGPAHRLRSRLRQRGIDGPERVVLSLGAGLVILPAVGLLLSVVPRGLSTTAITSALSGFVFIAAAAAVVRRARLPPDQRFSVSLRATATAATEALDGGTSAETAANVALVVSVVAAAATMGYAVAAPRPTGQYSDLSVLTRTDGGDLVAAGYPDTLGDDAPPVVIRVVNREGATQSYTVVAQLQRVADDGTVTERHRLTTFQPTLSPGERWTTRHRPDPAIRGTDLRLTYLLYCGGAPSNPTHENAYREVHLWVDA